VERVYKFITEDGQSTVLELWQVMPLVENKPADSEGGLKMWRIS
jgi:hypothetical protein